MRSATATPSSSALCASIGPRTTSPIAHTFGRLVRQSSSTATKPRSSSASPTASRAEPAGERHAADRHDQLVERRRDCALPALSVYATVTSVLADLDVGDRDAGVDREALLREQLLRFLRDRRVDDAEERRQRFQHRHLGAQPPPHAAHLEADHARADDAELLRHGGNRERAVVVEHAHVVDRDAGQRARLRAGRDDHVRGRELRRAWRRRPRSSTRRRPCPRTSRCRGRTRPCSS